MSDRDSYDDDLEHVKTLEVISKFCHAAHALIDSKRIPSVNLAMLALLKEINGEIQKVEASHPDWSTGGNHHA